MLCEQRYQLTQLGEMVVLHTKFSMFSKYLMHAWSRCGGLNELSIYEFMEACQNDCWAIQKCQAMGLFPIQC